MAVNAKLRAQPEEGFPRLLQRIQLAFGEQNKFKNKVNEYNESVDQVRRNLEQIIKPADTIKSKLPSYADKLKRHTELKEKLDNLINKKVLYTTEEIEAIVMELINNDVLVEPDELRRLIKTIKNQADIDAKEKSRLLKLLVDKTTENNDKQDVIIGKADEVKLLIEELVKQTQLNNLDDVREFINNLKDEGTLSKPHEIKKVLDEILKQGKIDAEEEKQLRIEILEHFKTKQAPPPQYWVQEFKDDINQNDFRKFVGIDSEYGIYINKRNYTCFGQSEININYNQSNDDKVHIQLRNNTGYDFSFSPDGFIELFGTLEPNILSITKQDFVNYAQLLNQTDIVDLHSNTYKTKLFITPIIKLYSNKRVTKQDTIDKKIEVLYDAILKDEQHKAAYPTTSSSLPGHTGQGLNTVIIPSSIKDMKERLSIIMASLKAGNNSTDMKNEASVLIDSLKKRRGINRKQEKL